MSLAGLRGEPKRLEGGLWRVRNPFPWTLGLRSDPQGGWALDLGSASYQGCVLGSPLVISCPANGPQPAQPGCGAHREALTRQHTGGVQLVLTTRRAVTTTFNPAKCLCSL